MRKVQSCSEIENRSKLLWGCQAETAKADDILNEHQDKVLLYLAI